MNGRVALGIAVGLAVAGAAFPAEYGTRDEAKAMLERVVAEMKKDKASTIQKINGKGFNDRDLYPFCSGPDGKVTANGGIPEHVGEDQTKLKDATGKPFGAEIREVAKPGQIAEVSYLVKRPGGKEEVPKVSLVTKVDDQVCAVGYYRK